MSSLGGIIGETRSVFGHVTQTQFSVFEILNTENIGPDQWLIRFAIVFRLCS